MAIGNKNLGQYSLYLSSFNAILKATMVVYVKMNFCFVFFTFTFKLNYNVKEKGDIYILKHSSK